jgi:hypothetical protein
MSYISRSLPRERDDDAERVQPERRERVHPEPEVFAKLCRLGVRVYLGPDKRLVLRRPGVMTIAAMETAQNLVRERTDEIRAELDR